MINEEIDLSYDNQQIIAAIEELKRCSPTDETDALVLQRNDAISVFSKVQTDLNSKTKLTELVKLSHSINLQQGKKSSWEEGEKDSVKDALRTIRDTLKNSLNLPADFIFINEKRAKTLLEGLDLFLERLFDEYDDRMRSYGAVDFNGLLFRTMKLLSEQSDITEFYRRLYKQILVDEFQDTDELQMNIIKILVANGENAPVLFLVGDENQSIYKFRGAEVSNFQKMIDETGMGDAFYITNNYRSQPNLIQFYNSFFSSFLGESDNGFEKLRSVREAISDLPNVQFLSPILGDDEDISVRESEADIMAKQIAAIVGVNKTLDGNGDERPLKFSDIGVLFWKRTKVNFYLEKFTEMGIPYYMSSKRGFHEKFEVIDLLNMLRVIERVGDEYSLAAWLRSPIVGLSDSALLLMGIKGGFESFLAKEEFDETGEEDKKRLIWAKEKLWEYRKIKDSMRPSEFIQKIVDEIAYIPFLLSMENGTQKALNIYKLLDQVSSFERSGNYTFGDFIENIDTLINIERDEGEAQASSENENVVSIMTVHGAKGLQFPVVFLPDLGASGSSDKDIYKFDTDKGFGFKLSDLQSTEIDPFYWILKNQDRKKDLDERKRLLYVAMTRAEDQLFFIGGREYHKDKLKSPHKNTWLRWLLDGIGMDHADETNSFEFDDLTIPIVRDLKESKPLNLNEDRGRAKEIEYPTKYSVPIEKETIPARITPTQLVTYIECPWKYALEQFHGIEEPEKELENESTHDLVASGKLFGSVAHKVLSKLDIKSDNDESLIAQVLSQEQLEKTKADEFHAELQKVLKNFRNTEIFKQLFVDVSPRTRFR